MIIRPSAAGCAETVERLLDALAGAAAGESAGEGA